MKYPVNGQVPGQGSSRSTRSDPLIKILLHPSTFNVLLSVAPSEAIRAAWKSGERNVERQRRRVLLVDCNEDQAKEGGGRWGEGRGYEESVEWVQGDKTRLLRVV